MIDDNTSTTTTGQQLLYNNNNNNNDNNNKGSIINNNWSLASLLAQEPRSVYDPPHRHHHRPTFTPHHHRHRRHQQLPPTVVDLDCSSPSRDPVPPSPFSCETCHKSFTDPSNLQRHVRSAHASARCHTCPDCGKAFATSSGLKQHQHIHSSVKPFRCEVCLKAYTQFSNLCRHKRMHADCRQQIRCRGCHQEFATSTSLSKHRRFCDDAGHHLEPYSLNRDANGAFSTLEGFSTSPAVTARGAGLPCGTLSTKSAGYSSLYGAQGTAGGICLYPNFFHPPFQFPLFQAGLPLFGSAGVVGGTNLMQVRRAGLSGRGERRRREVEGFYPTEEETVIDDEEEERSCSASSQVSSLSSRCLIDEGEDAKSPVSLPGTSPTDRSSSGSDDACLVSKVPRQRPGRGTVSSDSEYNLEEQGLRIMSPDPVLSAVGKTFEDIEAGEVSEGEESGTTTSESPKRSWDVDGSENSKGYDIIESPKRVKTLDTIENPKHSKTMETLESPKMLKTTDAIESPKRTKTVDTIEIPKRLRTLDTTGSPKRFNGTDAQTTHRIHDFTNVDEMATSEMLPLDLSLKSKPTSSPKHLAGYSDQKPVATSPVHSPTFQPTNTPSPPSHSCPPLPRWLHNNNTRPRPPGNDCALPPGFQDIAARIRSLQSTGVPMFPLCLPPRNFPGLSRQRDRVYPFLSPLMKGPVPSPFTGAPSAPMGKYKDRYSCRFCGKVFPRSANLTRHLRTHTGEQPYKCKYCERSFSISSNLQRHVRNIHNKEKPFRCLLCDRCFGQQTNLDRHLRKHDPPSLPGSPPPLLPRGRLRDREYSAEEDDVVPGKEEEEYQQLPGWDEIDDPVDVEMMTECNEGQLEEGSEVEMESRNEPEGVYLSDNDVEGCYDNRSSFSDDDDDDGKRFLPVYPVNGSFSVVSGLHVDT